MFLTPTARAEAFFERPPLSFPPEAGPPPQFVEAHARLSPHRLARGHLYRVSEGCLSLCRHVDPERRQLPPPVPALQGLGESLFFDTDVKRIDALVAFLRTLTDRRAWPPIAGRPAG